MMILDARLKRVEERTEARLLADFCLCVLDEEMSAIFRQYLADRGVAYEPENPYVVTRPCAICQRELSHDLSSLDEEERGVWHRLGDMYAEGWNYKRRTGRIPEMPEEFTRVGKWLKRRCCVAEERAFGDHWHEAFMFACRRAKELFPFAVRWVDEHINAHNEGRAAEVEK